MNFSSRNGSRDDDDTVTGRGMLAGIPAAGEDAMGLCGEDATPLMMKLPARASDEVDALGAAGELADMLEVTRGCGSKVRRQRSVKHRMPVQESADLRRRGALPAKTSDTARGLIEWRCAVRLASHSLQSPACILCFDRRKPPRASQASVPHVSAHRLPLVSRGATIAALASMPRA